MSLKFGYMWSNVYIKCASLEKFDREILVDQVTRYKTDEDLIG